MRASWKGHVDGAHVDLRNDYGATALIDAAIYGHLHFVQLLLQAGAQKDLCDNFHCTALMLAALQGCTQSGRAAAAGGWRSG